MPWLVLWRNLKGNTADPMEQGGCRIRVIGCCIRIMGPGSEKEVISENPWYTSNLIRVR